MTDPTNVHEPVPQSAKLTAREKKWIIYDVGNSAFVLLSTAVIPIYAKSLMPADGNIVSAWGYAQTIASLVIALLMPLLGSIADVQGMKIKFFLGSNQTPQDRLAKYYEREGDALARFRLGGTERLYGFLVGNEFHILWWDPNHEVWPSTRKHT